MARGGARKGAGRQRGEPPNQPQETGRPSSYKSEFAEQGQKLCELGATDLDIADFFGVDVRTVYRWKHDFPAFCQSLKAGKDAADDRVERSLYHKACGYSFEAVKIFPPRVGESAALQVPYREHVPPDSTACIFWLKNRRKDDWRDRQEHEHAGKDGGPIKVEEQPLPPSELGRRIAFLLSRALTSEAK